VLPGYCRYFICDAKLFALGWQERTLWEVGLKKTVDWYLEHAADHWDSGESGPGVGRLLGWQVLAQAA
jgi:dTDP-D-glucose 4,6-dehydratase